MAVEIWITLITSLTALITVVVKVIADKRRNGQYKYNPHPPGDAKACVEHGEAIRRMEDKIDKLGERIARVEGRLNGRT